MARCTEPLDDTATSRAIAARRHRAVRACSSPTAESEGPPRRSRRCRRSPRRRPSCSTSRTAIRCRSRATASTGSRSRRSRRVSRWTTPRRRRSTGWAAFDAGDRPIGARRRVRRGVGRRGDRRRDRPRRRRWACACPTRSRPSTTTDKFRIASISKTITAITVLQLVEEGLVGLDDPVGALVAERCRRRLRRAPAPPAITVRQLLTHTSGFAAVREHVLPQPGRLVRGGGRRRGSAGRCGRGLPLQQHELLRARSADRAAHRANRTSRSCTSACSPRSGSRGCGWPRPTTPAPAKS